VGTLLSGSHATIKNNIWRNGILILIPRRLENGILYHTGFPLSLYHYSSCYTLLVADHASCFPIPVSVFCANFEQTLSEEMMIFERPAREKEDGKKIACTTYFSSEFI